MSEPTITCPYCKKEIKLTESLAAPLVESTKKTFENELVAQTKKIKEDEARRARDSVIEELNRRAAEVGEMRQVMKGMDAKLALAQQAQVEVMRKGRELDEAKRELDLTVEKRIQEGIGQAQVRAKREAEDALALKVSEKEKTISDMQKQIEELRLKAEQGSQQLQGEVLELELESFLKSKFPSDSVEPVAKGERGADLLQKVLGANGQIFGSIIWESKRTKNWSDGWLVKLRDDQRAAKADIAILLSYALPKGLETFGLIDGVWVAHPRLALPVATLIRQSLAEVAMTRAASEGLQTKTGMVYEYMTGPRFRQRIQAIVEAFSSMREDLDKEKKAITRQWAKRDEQIERVMLSTVGMYGDLQGIAGKSMAEIEGIGFKAICEGESSAT
jgi:hypothetical protein